MNTCPRCQGAFEDGTPVCPNDGAALEPRVGEATLPVAQDWSGGPPRRSDDATDPLLGATLAGRYHVLRRLGQGGMGAVYEATHAVIGRPVAVKVLHERYVERPEVAARLMNEARLASSIRNEHIVEIFDFGETTDGRTFVVMELLEGESLAQIMRREGPLKEARVLGLCLQVCDALGAAHERGIIHRDIKPENIFVLRRDGAEFVKVVDFGISKAMREGHPDAQRLTHTGMVLGTPLYMSPEQARGEDAIDHRIDVYALGVILYESLTDEVPFRGSNYLGIISDVLSRAPVPPRQARPDLAISDAANRVVVRAMAKEREQRYGTMHELGEDLRRALAGQEVAPMPRAASAAARRRRQALYGLVAAIVTGVLVTTAVVTRRPSGLGGPGAPPGLMAAGASSPAAAARPGPSSPAPDDRAGLAAPATAPPAPPPSATVEVAIESRPPGAAIYDGPRRLGQAPVRLTLPRSTEPVTLTFRLDGYRAASYRFTPRTDGETLPIELQPLPHRSRAAARAALHPRTDVPPVTDLPFK